MKNLTIVFQHDGILPVSTYGGTERIMYWHMKELVRRGHRVLLIGHPASTAVCRVGIELIPIPEADLKTDRWQKLVPSNADVLHLQYNCKPKDSPAKDIPLVNTIHGNGKAGEVFDENAVFVSQNHAHRHGATAFVYNALDFAEFPLQILQNRKDQKNWHHFLFLAKASWKVKNLKDCLRAAKETQHILHVAGGRAWWPSRYVKNHGMVGGQEKLSLLQECDALLFPVRWHEPFGLAIIEAMAMGMPVIGSPYGALPEIIEHGKTGFLCQNFSQLKELLATKERPAQLLPPNEIREHIAKRFSIEQYTNHYLEIYQKVMKGEKLNSTPPTFLAAEKAEDLLPF